MKKRNFNAFRFENCRSAAMARKLLADKDLGQYWDLAMQIGSVPE